MIPNRSVRRRDHALMHFKCKDDELAGLSRDQRNKRISDAIRELFPLIPDRDVEEIIIESFGEVRYKTLHAVYV